MRSRVRSKLGRQVDRARAEVIGLRRGLLEMCDGYNHLERENAELLALLAMAKGRILELEGQ